MRSERDFRSGTGEVGARRGDDQIHRFVFGAQRERVEKLEGVADRDAQRSPGQGERVVVEAAPEAEPAAARLEAEAGHDEELERVRRGPWRSGRRGRYSPVREGEARRIVDPVEREQRWLAPLDARVERLSATGANHRSQRRRIDLAGQGGIEGDAASARKRWQRQNQRADIQGCRPHRRRVERRPRRLEPLAQHSLLFADVHRVQSMPTPEQLTPALLPAGHLRLPSRLTNFSQMLLRLGGDGGRALTLAGAGDEMRNVVRRVAVVGEIDPRVAESLRDLGYRVDRVGSDLAGSTFRLAKELRSLRPTLIHARQDHLRVSLIAKFLRLPVLLQASGKDVSISVAQAARLAARTVCGGALARNALVQLGAPASSTTVVRGLLDMKGDSNAASIFPPLLDPAIRWVVAAAPVDGPDRGHTDLLLAFLTAARMRPKLKLLIAGEGSSARLIRAHADQARMCARIVVHEVPLEQLPGIFARAAVVVGPSRSTVLPDPVPEALAMGAPVVATAVGSHPTWIREGRTGWLVPARAPVALAARLTMLLDDPELARKVGHNAQLAALELVQPRAVAQELARTYAAIARPVTGRAAVYRPAALPQRA